MVTCYFKLGGLKNLESVIILVLGATIFFSIIRIIEFRKSTTCRKKYLWTLFISSAFLIPFLPDADFAGNLIFLFLFSLPLSLAIYSFEKKWFFAVISLLLSIISQIMFDLYVSLHWQFLFDKERIIEEFWYGKFLSWYLIDFMKVVSNCMAIGALVISILFLIKAKSTVTKIFGGIVIFYAILSCNNIFIVV